jgi:hypothetical protein
MIFIEQDTPYTRDEVEQKLKVLKDAVRENETKVSSENITAAMKQVIPTFHSPDEINEAVNESDEMRVANES